MDESAVYAIGSLFAATLVALIIAAGQTMRLKWAQRDLKDTTEEYRRYRMDTFDKMRAMNEAHEEKVVELRKSADERYCMGLDAMNDAYKQKVAELSNEITMLKERLEASIKTVKTILLNRNGEHLAYTCSTPQTRTGRPLPVEE